MKQLTLQSAWEVQSKYWKQMVQQGRLPVYRDWRLPATDCLRGIRLSGLTIFFLGDLSWLPGMVLQTDLKALEKQHRGDPFGFRVVYQSPKRIDMIPVFRETNVRGGLKDKQPIQASNPKAADQFITGLGYRTRSGRKFSLEGRLISVPKALDSKDALAEVIRIACHREWARRDHKGYLGAEMVFALIAAELGLDCSSLRCSKPLYDEIASASVLSFVTESILATVTAGQLLGDALGANFRTLFFDTMTTPETLNHHLKNTIICDGFFD